MKKNAKDSKMHEGEPYSSCDLLFLFQYMVCRCGSARSQGERLEAGFNDRRNRYQNRPGFRQAIAELSQYLGRTEEAIHSQVSLALSEQAQVVQDLKKVWMETKVFAEKAGLIDSSFCPNVVWKPRSKKS